MGVRDVLRDQFLQGDSGIRRTGGCGKMIKKLSPRRVILIAVAFLLLAGVCYML